jgi:hypothetical protein
MDDGSLRQKLDLSGVATFEHIYKKIEERIIIVNTKE